MAYRSGVQKARRSQVTARGATISNLAPSLARTRSPSLGPNIEVKIESHSEALRPVSEAEENRAEAASVSAGEGQTITSNGDVEMIDWVPSPAAEVARTPPRLDNEEVRWPNDLLVACIARGLHALPGTTLVAHAGVLRFRFGERTGRVELQGVKEMKLHISKEPKIKPEDTIVEVKFRGSEKHNPGSFMGMILLDDLPDLVHGGHALTVWDRRLPEFSPTISFFTFAWCLVHWLQMMCLWQWEVDPGDWDFCFNIPPSCATSENPLGPFLTAINLLRPRHHRVRVVCHDSGRCSQWTTARLQAHAPRLYEIPTPPSHARHWLYNIYCAHIWSVRGFLRDQGRRFRQVNTTLAFVAPLSSLKSWYQWFNPAMLQLTAQDRVQLTRAFLTLTLSCVANYALTMSFLQNTDGELPTRPADVFDWIENIIAVQGSWPASSIANKAFSYMQVIHDLYMRTPQNPFDGPALEGVIERLRDILRQGCHPKLADAISSDVAVIENLVPIQESSLPPQQPDPWRTVWSSLTLSRGGVSVWLLYANVRGGCRIVSRNIAA